MEDISVSPRQTDLIDHVLAVMINETGRISGAFSQKVRADGVRELKAKFMLQELERMEPDECKVYIRLNRKTMTLRASYSFSSVGYTDRAIFSSSLREEDMELLHVRKIISYINKFGVSRKAIHLGKRATIKFKEDGLEKFDTYLTALLL